MLQILINHYKEPEKIIGRLLKSIENQESLPKNTFEVFIYSDGNEQPLSENFLKSFNFPIKHKVLEHSGVCHTRNVLMDDATAEYIMFCDADDCFHSNLGLYKLLKAAKDFNADIVGAPYEQETLINNCFEYKTLLRETVRVHAKIFKRSYLLENNIRFPDEQQFSGDMYFLWLAYNLTKKVTWINDSIYIWKYYNESVTRKNKYHHLEAYPTLVKTYILVAENLIQRQKIGFLKSLVCAFIQKMYLNETNDCYMNGPEETLILAREAMIKFLKEYGHYYQEIPMDYKEKIYELNVKRIGEGNRCKGLIDIPNWIDNMLKK